MKTKPNSEGSRSIFRNLSFRLLSLSFLLMAFQANAQFMKIDRNGGNPDSSAALEVSDTSRGFLPPRLTTTQMNAISSPASGLLIFNTSDSSYKFFDGVSWEDIGSASNSSLSKANIYSIKIQNNGSASIISQTGDFVDSVKRVSAGTVNIYFKTGVFTQAPSVVLGGVRANNHYGEMAALAATKDSVQIETYNLNASSSYDADFDVTFVGQGSDYSSNSSSSSTVSSIDESGIVLIKDVKTSDGGTFTSGAWQTRDLNTLEGDTSFASLSSNQFTLDVGVYSIEWSAPALAVGSHQSRLYNVTDAILQTVGTGAWNETSQEAQTTSIGQASIELASSKTFRIEHRCASTWATVGFGAGGFGDRIYTQVKITKLDKVFGSGTSSASSSSADTLDENTYYGVTSSTAVISSANTFDFYSVAKGGTGVYNYTLKNELVGLSNAPVVMVQPYASDYLHAVGSITSSGFTVYTYDALNTLADADHSISVTRQGSDYRYNTSGASASALASSTSPWTLDADSVTVIGKRVGIGTSSPSNLLDVSSGTSGDAILSLTSDTDNNDEADNPAIELIQDGGAVNAFFKLEGTANTSASSSRANSLLIGQSESYPLQLLTNNIPRLTIDPGGDLGIGTTTPSASLVVTDSTGDATVYIHSASGAGVHDASIGFINDGSLQYSMGFDETDSTFKISTVGLGSNEFVMNSEGYLGLGTSSPISIIDYNASNGSLFRVNTNFAHLLQHNKNSGVYWSAASRDDGSYDLSVSTSDPGTGVVPVSGTKLRIDSSGNVGIGTSSPNHELQIHDASANHAYTQWTNSTSGSGSTDGGLIGQFGSDLLIHNYENGNLSFRTNNTTRMTVDNSGNVGIGTTSTSDKFEVANAATVNVNLHSTTSSTSDDIKIKYSKNGTNKYITGYDAGIDEFVWSGTNFVSNRMMYLNSSGYLGIGVQSAGRELHVHDGSSSGSYMQFTNTTTGSSSTSVGTTVGQSGDDFIIWNYEPGDIRIRTNNSERMRIEAGGDIGIGTTSPHTKLTVADHITPSVNNTYSLGTTTYRWNTVYATNGTINTSDRRLKTNIRELEYGLDEVLSLKAKSFNWKESPNEQQKLGFMAQDLLEIIPEVVVIGEDSLETLGVHYSDLIPVLTKAIQEQQAMIENLKAENGSLKSNLQDQTSNIRHLKSAIQNQKSEMNEINAKLNEQHQQIILIQKTLNEGMGKR